MRVVMSRSSIRLFGVFAMAAAFGLVTAYRAPGQGEVVAPPRQLDFKCTPNSVCLGLQQPNNTACGANGTCRGNASTAVFSVCKSMTSQFCTPDHSQYGSASCPGLCVGMINQTCNVVAVGCQ